MKVLLLDPKLLNRRGHYFHTDLAIYEECTARGLPIEILANQKVAPDILERLPARPFFAVTAQPAGASTTVEVANANRLVEKDLTEGCHALGPDDVVLVPSCRDGHLGGMYRWYSTLPEPRPRVCLRLLFKPGFDAKEEGALAAALAEEQMRAWASVPAGMLSLVAERHELAVFYEALCDRPVAVLPMLIRYPTATAAPAERPTQRAPHIIFLGEGRREKGFHLLPDAFRAVLAKYPEIRLTLQTSDRFDLSANQMRSLSALSPNVSIVRGPLSVEEYHDLLLSSDVVLLAYDPDSYALRTSQIFLEAVGTGKVVLTTRGTWMQQEMERLGLGDVYVEDFTSEGIAGATARVLREWPVLAERARLAAPRVRQQHNPARFVDALLCVLGGVEQESGHGAWSLHRVDAGRR